MLFLLQTDRIVPYLQGSDRSRKPRPFLLVACSPLGQTSQTCRNCAHGFLPAWRSMAEAYATRVMEFLSSSSSPSPFSLLGPKRGLLCHCKTPYRAHRSGSHVEASVVDHCAALPNFVLSASRFKLLGRNCGSQACSVTPPRYCKGAGLF